MPRPTAAGHAGPKEPAAAGEAPPSPHLVEAEADAPPVLKFYRLYFRKPKGRSTWGSNDEVLVQGEAERDRVLAQKRPKAIFWEVALIHECSTCGATGPWIDGWSWFGSESDLEAGRPIRKFCTKRCWPAEKLNEKRPEGVDWDDWPRVSGFEPDPLGSVRLRWKALREANDAPLAHRKVPMPEWPGPGTCRWCLKPTIWESGKRKGKPAPQRKWHNDCYYRYQLHTELDAQFSYLFTRDGPFCQICGKGGFAKERTFEPPDWETLEAWMERTGQRGAVTYLKPSIRLEVDHVIPLWRANEFSADLADRQRLYGPENLWLLCAEGEFCHKAKSAIEAAERAAIKRSRTGEG